MVDMGQYQSSVHRNRELPLFAAADRGPRVKPTPLEPLIVSVSELATFLRCRVKWSWRYGHKLQPKRGAPPLAFGTLIHLILEKWYSLPPLKRNRKRMEKIAYEVTRSATMKELTSEDMELIVAMTVGYAGWAKIQDAEDGIVECFPEEFFDLPLVDDGSIRVRGKIDNRFTPVNQKKTLGCMEHKSKGQIKLDVVELNHQLTVYLFAMREKYPGFKRYKALYNVLRKQMPGPRVKADLFAREEVERTDDQIAQWKEDTKRVALDMLDAAIYPNPMDACQWDCDFKIPCLTRGIPEDVEYILKTEYVRKERDR